MSAHDGFVDFFFPNNDFAFDLANHGLWSRNTGLYFMHGGLMLFEDSSGGVSKAVAQGTGAGLLSGLRDAFRPDQLPKTHATDEEHRKWRADVIRAAKSRGLPFTHGVAAKLVNIYLKSRFVCGGHHAHERVQNLHPPIDAVLLKTLAKQNVGGNAKDWRLAARTGWSKFGSEDYERVVELIRQSMNGVALWMVEEHWRGNQ